VPGLAIKPAGVILAGGRSRRMGGGNKALLNLAGKPLLQHVIDRIRPQVAELYLSVEQPSGAVADFGLPQVTDAEMDGGPLVGLLAALRKIGPRHEWLLLAPCDAPFVPSDLAERLSKCAVSAGRPGAVVRYQTELQPTFSLWNRCLLPRLEQAVVQEKMAGFKQFLGVVQLAALDWPGSQPSPFFNINDQAALRAAVRLFEAETGVTGPCSV